MTVNVTDLNAKVVTLITGLAPAPLNERGGRQRSFDLILCCLLVCCLFL